MKQPGIKDAHRIVTAQCLENRGVEGCLEEVTKDILKSIKDFDWNGWAKAGGKLHVITVIERPQDQNE